jgi:hypothetical protein
MDLPRLPRAGFWMGAAKYHPLDWVDGQSTSTIAPKIHFHTTKTRSPDYCFELMKSCCHGAPLHRHEFFHGKWKKAGRDEGLTT